MRFICRNRRRYDQEQALSAPRIPAPPTESGGFVRQVADKGLIVGIRRLLGISAQPSYRSAESVAVATNSSVVEIELPDVFRGKISHHPPAWMLDARCSMLDARFNESIHHLHGTSRGGWAEIPKSEFRNPNSKLRGWIQHRVSRIGWAGGRGQRFGGSSLPSSTYSCTQPLTRPVSRRIEIRLGIVIRPSAMSPKAHTSSSE